MEVIYISPVCLLFQINSFAGNKILGNEARYPKNRNLVARKLFNKG